MFRYALLVFLIPLPAIAQAKPTRQWRHIAQLPSGTELFVREQNRHFATPCTLAWIDTASLACDQRADDGSTQRVVYPAASVASVKPMQTWHSDADESHVTPIIVGFGIGAVIGGFADSSGGAGGVATGAFLLGAVGAGFGAMVADGATPPRQQGLRLRLPLGTHRLRHS